MYAGYCLWIPIHKGFIIWECLRHLVIPIAPCSSTGRRSIGPAQYRGVGEHRDRVPEAGKPGRAFIALKRARSREPDAQDSQGDGQSW